MRDWKCGQAFQDNQISISASSLCCCTSSIVCNEDLCFPPASIWHPNILFLTHAFLSDLDFIYNWLEEQTNNTKDRMKPLYRKHLGGWRSDTFALRQVTKLKMYVYYVNETRDNVEQWRMIFCKSGNLVTKETGQIWNMILRVFCLYYKVSVCVLLYFLVNFEHIVLTKIWQFFCEGCPRRFSAAEEICWPRSGI